MCLILFFDISESFQIDDMMNTIDSFEFTNTIFIDNHNGRDGNTNIHLE